MICYSYEKPTVDQKCVSNVKKAQLCHLISQSLMKMITDFVLLIQAHKMFPDTHFFGQYF